MSLPAPVVCEPSPRCCEGSKPFFGQGKTYLSVQGGLTTPCPTGFICDPGFYPPGIPFTPPVGANPIRLTTCDGVEIVRYLPPNYTQAQFDEVAQEMANIAAIHVAFCNGQRLNTDRIFVRNDQQTVTCPDGETSVVPEGYVQIPVNNGFICNDPAPLVITTPSEIGLCLGARAGFPPLLGFQATGGVPFVTAPTFEFFYQWRILTGDVPPGLTLGGKFSGVPTETGFFTFVVECSDNAARFRNVGGIANRVTKQIRFRIMSIETSAVLPGGTAGVPYDPVQLEASDSGNIGVLEWNGIDTPPGLTVSTSGEISGTPTLAGSYTFFVTVRDNANAPNNPINSVTCQKLFSISIS